MTQNVADDQSATCHFSGRVKWCAYMYMYMHFIMIFASFPLDFGLKKVEIIHPIWKVPV